jgi:sorting nexin-9/18/33
MSQAERLLSYSLLSLITSQPLASAPTTGVTEEDEEYLPQDKGLRNKEGAWCWREGCEGRLLFYVVLREFGRINADDLSVRFVL